MASAKKKKTSKKVAPKKAAKKKAAPKTVKKTKAKPKAKAKKPAAAKKKAPAKQAKQPKQPKQPKQKDGPTHGDSWGNASLAPKVKAPKITHVEPSGTPELALHDHEGALVSPVEESEEVAERIHGGEEAVKDDEADGDAGSPVLDDRDDDGDSE